MSSRKVKKVHFVIAAIVILAVCVSWLAFPPVIISMTFDPETQIARLTVTNESSRSLLFFDSFSERYRGPVTDRKVPGAIRVKVLSQDGTVLSRYSIDSSLEGWINVEDLYYTLGRLPLKMTVLSPHETVTGESKLKDLIGTIPPYSRLTELKEFCVQFKARIFFNSYMLFPKDSVSEVTCISEGMK